MDPDFIDELMARIAAQGERNQAIAAARAARSRRRYGSYAGQRGYYEVSDVSIA